jgi:type II secretory ATPase GspE/PulE/Tfp pilus assembly ATPase PilB-like protein
MSKDQEGPPPIWTLAPPVEFKPSGDSSQSQAKLILGRQSPAFGIAAGLLGHALACRSTDILMDFTQQATTIRYQIDGMWEQLPPMDRATGDATLQVLKQLNGLNPADRRSKQAAAMELKSGKEKLRCEFQSQGVPTGERVLVHFVPLKIPFGSLFDLGMRDKMVDALKQSLNAGGGLVLFSAPKGQGLSTTWNLGLQSADKFVRDFQSVEDKNLQEPEIINVTQNFFEGAENAADAARQLTLREPDVFVMPDLINDEVFQVLYPHVKTRDCHIITRIVADDTIDAVLKLLATYKKSAKQILEILTCVTSQKLGRRLCEKCKQGFQPPPQLLQKLGIPAGRISLLYRQFVPPPIEQQVDEKGNPAPIPPCPNCGGRGFFGRVAVFETLLFTPEIREAFSKTNDTTKLRQVIREAGQRGVQEEAVLTVARGLTSLEEVKRIFAPAK